MEILVKDVDLNTLINMLVLFVFNPQVTKREIIKFIVELFAKGKINLFKLFFKLN